MLEALKGKRPDITAAQVLAFLIAGVPQLLVLFGVDLSDAQDAALDNLLILGGALIGGDVLLRGARNWKDGKVEAAALTPAAPAEATGPPVGPPAGEVAGDVDGDGFLDEEERALAAELAGGGLPSDEQEFAAGGARTTPEPPDAGGA